MADKRKQTITSATVGQLVFVKSSGRVGEVVKRTPADSVTTHKLRFNDGRLPGEDWFAADAIEPLPTLGSITRVKGTKRVGTLIQHTPKDNTHSHKISFSDGVKPLADWFSADQVEVQPGLTELHHRAEKLRREAVEQLAVLQNAIKADFADYKKRLEMMGGMKTSSAIAKIAVGFIPGGHVVSEGVSAASYMAELQQLLKDCSELGFMGLDAYTMYKTRSSSLDSEEDVLLKVLTKSTKMMGEKYVIGGHDEEPSQRVVKNLLKMKAVCERLNTLDAMGFFNPLVLTRSKL